jgi:hypothetical protein
MTSYYNPQVWVEELRILLALEPIWSVSVNGLEFLSLAGSEISIHDYRIQIGPHSRKIVDLKWLRPTVVQIKARAKFRSKPDVITLYPGDRLPSTVDLRRRRRAFQQQIGPALCAYFGTRKLERQTLHSDRQHAIGGAYPRFLIGKEAVIAVDPDESSAVINGIMRAALLWAPLVRRHIAVVVPRDRRYTVSARLDAMPHIRAAFEWLQWDGSSVAPLAETHVRPETHVQALFRPQVDQEVSRIRNLAPDLLQAVPDIAGKAVSIRLRGIEIARVSEDCTTYPLGTPIERVIREVDQARRYGSRHALAHAHEERWLESNLLGQIRQVLPSVDSSYVYPQVPSFVGEERSVIDLLTVTNEGRLVVIEIKAAPDPDLLFQAFDYWLAVERHRKANDFLVKGYFQSCRLKDQPAVLVLIAPLLSYHRVLARLVPALPPSLPLVEIGINQDWKRHLKILRRRGRSVSLKSEKPR